MPLCLLFTNFKRSELDENIEERMAKCIADIAQVPLEMVFVFTQAELPAFCAGSREPALICQIHCNNTFNDQQNVAGYYPKLFEVLKETSKLPGKRYDMKSPRREILHDINPRVIAPGKPLYNNTFNTTRRASLRMGDWKVITGHPVAGPSSKRESSEDLDNFWLFNLAIDPTEITDLSYRFPEIAQHMLKRLEQYQIGMVPLYDYPVADGLANLRFNGGFWEPWL